MFLSGGIFDGNILTEDILNFALRRVNGRNTI